MMYAMAKFQAHLATKPNLALQRCAVRMLWCRSLNKSSGRSRICSSSRDALRGSAVPSDGFRWSLTALSSFEVFVLLGRLDAAIIPPSAHREKQRQEDLCAGCGQKKPAESASSTRGMCELRSRKSQYLKHSASRPRALEHSKTKFKL